MISVTKGDTVSEGVDNMINAMMSDYASSSGRIKMYETKVGKKYIKVVQDTGVFCFIAKEDFKHFKKGDILKAAGYNAPALNSARGNVLTGNYAIQWTGPLYLK